MADLITLAEYKALTGTATTDTRDDAQITALLPAVSRSIRSFTDRTFDIAAAPGPREFQYDGSGFLDIDDCTAITQVTSNLGYPPEVYTLESFEYTPMPHREQTTDNPYYYLLIHSYRLPGSPEMGFERNLDTLGWIPQYPLVTVTATWGWPAVPEDVKLATAWTVQDVISTPSSGPTAEAIEGWSRSWGREGKVLAVPNRARDLLANYQRAYG